MGQLYIPAKKNISGSWLIGQSSLTDLHSTIEEIAAKIKQLPVKEVTSFEQKVTLTSRDGKKLIDQSIAGILRDQRVDDFFPKKLSVKVVNGPNQFYLEVTSLGDSSLDYEVSIDDQEIQGDIKYTLDYWIEKWKPKKVYQLWPGLALALR